MLVPLAGNLIGQVIGLFGQKGQASKEALQARMGAMERSWTDEILVVYWFSPGIASWIDPVYATTMIAAMFSNTELVALQGAITAAVFGLGKVNGRKK